MSIVINNEQELNGCLAANPKLAVLFYASWCPYSLKFLPIFEKQSTGKDKNFRRLIIDDLEALADKYGIEVYPSVIYFENGKITKRLDGIHGVGLNEKQLTEFVAVCKIK